MSPNPHHSILDTPVWDEKTVDQTLSVSAGGQRSFNPPDTAKWAVFSVIGTATAGKLWLTTTSTGFAVDGTGFGGTEKDLLMWRIDNPTTGVLNINNPGAGAVLCGCVFFF